MELPDPAQSALTTGDCDCDWAWEGDGLGSSGIKSLLSNGGSGPESCSNLYPHTYIFFISMNLSLETGRGEGKFNRQ